MNKRTGGIAAIALLLVVGLAWRACAGGYDFDPEVVGASEARMWKAYYAKNKVELGREMLELQQGQFGLSMPVALHIAEPMARGAYAFSGSRGDYETKVLPSLVEGYSRLRTVAGGSWDPEEAARAELSWWVARRTKGQDSPEEVGRRIADLYAILYGERNEDIERAGFLRAEAAERRDVESTRGQPDWKAIEGMLVESYRALHRGVNG